MIQVLDFILNNAEVIVLTITNIVAYFMPPPTKVKEINK